MVLEARYVVDWGAEKLKLCWERGLQRKRFRGTIGNEKVLLFAVVCFLNSLSSAGNLTISLCITLSTLV